MSVRKFRAYGLLILVFGLPCTPAHAEPSTPGTHPNRWRQTFNDDFNGTSLDTTKWEAAMDNRQGGKSTWDPAHVSVGNGLLRLGITKVVDPATGATIRYDCGAVRGRKGYTTNYTLKQKYGYYESCYKLPARIDKDYWASFWLMAGPVITTKDTRVGMEIDIMESFTFDRPVHTANFHWGGYGADHNKYSLDCGTWPKQQVLNPSGAYHVFGFYWDINLYVFYLDGVEIGRTDMNNLGSTANGLEASHGTTQAEGYMLLSCEASTWPGDNSQAWDVDAPTQDEFLVDYVRVYEMKPAFEVWSTGSEATFAGDTNGDGISDGVAWMLGSPSPGQSANALLPTTRRSIDGGCMVLFTCLNATNRGSASLSLQFSRDLGITDSWENHTVIIPSSSGTDPSSGVAFVITADGDLNQVQATIPASAANGGGRIFCRLKALPTP